MQILLNNLKINSMQKKKLLTLQDFGKVLVSYLRTPSKFKAVVDYTKLGPRAKLVRIGGEKIGVIVALGPNILGWSLCRTKDYWNSDTFDKEKGISIALSRANYISSLTKEQRDEYYADKLPTSLYNLFQEMKERSEKYFNYNK